MVSLEAADEGVAVQRSWSPQPQVGLRLEKVLRLALEKDLREVIGLE